LTSISIQENMVFMDVRLSPEQRALQESASQVVDRLGPKAVGQLDDAERTAKLDATVAAAGWRELRTATDDGTPWASAVEAALVAEELARGLADTAFIGPVLAGELRRLAGAPTADGLETVALRADLGGLAIEPSDGVAIDAAGASHSLFLVGGTVVRVELDSATTSRDLTRAVATLGSRVEPLGATIDDDDGGRRWAALGLALTCADLVGTMTGAVRLATVYAAERKQYGQPVGAFQAVQHLRADAHVATEGTRSAALHAAWAVDALAPADAVAAAATAKAYCARAARTVCETAIQVHGGIGNTWECLAHVHLRRALVSTDILGGVGPSLDRVLEHHGLR
jgi:alkylation response protein AidB-like acyl-CoA dehydrogenase